MLFRSAPLVPLDPELAEVPDEADVPAVRVKPELPDDPEEPLVPEVPVEPEVPDVPLEPDVPEEPSPPDAPSRLTVQEVYVPLPTVRVGAANCKAPVPEL